MGVHYSYNCVSAKNLRDVGTYGKKRLVLVDLQFEDEHGHLLAPCADVPVSIEEGAARLVDYPEDVLDDADVDDETWQRVESLCSGYPGYDVHDEVAFSALFAG